ncbi:hypothetical protein [Morganella morganii]|uniref:hypothetical protein n=1 Tax=Morganella morganii TaxID=582 RepID=UPI001A1D0786|nr:hypothetical protein [Morganella morganii]HAU5616735.1 hypothetical protein [Morganella morganii]HDQ2581176.1 hypothetical protein [Morganella morganii]
MDISRQQFEEYIKFHAEPAELERELKKANNGINYHHPVIDLMWISWQASRDNLDIDKIKKERNEAIGHLISVFDQYAGLDHSFMSAGEDACEFLEKLGYGVDTGRIFALNEKTLELTNGE